MPILCLHSNSWHFIRRVAVAYVQSSMPKLCKRNAWYIFQVGNLISYVPISTSLKVEPRHPVMPQILSDKGC